METEAEKICHNIQSHLPNVKSGTLRFWGEWFGRPYDNIHTVIGCKFEQDTLVISFNQNEKLTVIKPQHFEINKDTFFIRNAEQVIWNWYYYGKPQEPENLYYQKFILIKNRIEVTTNVDWYQPVFKTDISSNAIEIL